MSGICGLVVRGPAIDAEASFGRMLARLARFPHAQVDHCRDGDAWLGRVANRADVVRDAEAQPFRIGSWSIVNQVRLDEPAAARRRLLPLLERRSASDGQVLARAMVDGDNRAYAALPGDWIMAGWQRATHTLYLAREPYGVKSLYYVELDDLFAFATTMDALLALPSVPRDIDELHVARSVTRWAGVGESGEPHGTVFKAVRFLPPAHSLSWCRGRLGLERYWKLESAIEPIRIGFADAAHELRQVVARAVSRRMQDGAQLCTTLSAGLDSSTVTALAAHDPARRGRQLTAYCSVPRYPQHAVMPASRFGDEGPIARAFAERLPAVGFVPIDSADVTPIEGLERTIDVACQPFYATSNDHWLHSLYARAARDGNEVILIGAMGNLTLSWGFLATQSRVSLLLAGRLRTLLAHARQRGPFGYLRRRITNPSGPPWGEYSCIGPAFAERLKLAERMRAQGRDPRMAYAMNTDGRIERMSWFAPKTGVGVLQDVFSKRYGLDVSDPSADTELILFTLGLPERVFTGPRQTPRWLIREAMRDLLPDAITANRKRGYQAADLGAKLIADGNSVDALLARLESDPRTADMLDVPKLKIIWDRVKRKNTDKVQRDAWGILLNGLSTGIFLLQHG